MAVHHSFEAAMLYPSLKSRFI